MNFKLTALLLSLGLMANAQESSKFSAKIYGSYTFEHQSSIISGTNQVITSTNINLGRLIPAVARPLKKGFLELSVSQLRANQNSSFVSTAGLTPSAGRSSSFEIATRLEYNFPIFEKSKFHTYVSGGVEPGYYNMRFVSDQSSEFRTSTNGVYLNYFLAPRITYDINDRLTFETLWPIQIAKHSYQNDFINDPTFTSGTTHTSTFETFPGLIEWRFGLGYKF